MKKLLVILLALLLLYSPVVAETDLSNMSESELQDLINQASAQLELLRSVQTENLEALELSGTGAKILTNINIGFSPSRITFEQNKKGEFTVSYVLGEKSREIISEYSGTKCVTEFNKTGVFEFDVEASSPWKMLIEPIEKTTEPLNIKGKGDCVTSIYTINTSTILSLSAKYNDFDNFIVYAYTSTDGFSWSEDLLVNGLESAGKTETIEKIIRATKPTYIFFSIDFDNGEWSIKPQ